MIKLHCSVVPSSHIVPLSLLNLKAIPGHRIVPQIKVICLNMFRDFSYKTINIKLIFAIFEGNSPKFFFLKAPTATIVNLILTCWGQGNRQMILITEIIRMFSVNMCCTMSIFKVGKKKHIHRTKYNVYSRRCIFNMLGRLIRFLTKFDMILSFDFV